MQHLSSQIEGNTYNNLLVVSLNRKDKYTTSKGSRVVRFFYNCECVCGKTTVVEKYKLISGKTKSCGCFRKQISKVLCINKSTHNMSKTRFYKCWRGMITRCTANTGTHYKNYKQRGIIFEKSWRSFENFYKDMNESYKEGLTLDRIDNDKGYSKENCRWATIKEQQKNKQNTVQYKGILGVNRSIELGGTRDLINCRLSKGWTLERAFNTPKRLW